MPPHPRLLKTALGSAERVRHSHRPTTLHVVILEFGSMAFHLHHAAVEGAARMLLSLRPRPLLIFISMHEWCADARLARTRTHAHTHRMLTSAV